MEKLKFKQIMSLTLTLFAIFFGAGNMIFPPAMGQLAGFNRFYTNRCRYCFAWHYCGCSGGQ